MSDVKGYFTNSVSSDLLALVTGDLIGEGVARSVYIYKPNPELIIKFETGSQSFQNIREWQTWDELRWHKTAKKWLAPCISISPCGSVLLQQRTAPLRKKELAKYPQLPEFLTDVKVENFGMLDGRLVCHDYGCVRYGWSEKMRKADWRP